MLFVGRFTAVIVTGYELGLAMVTTASPVLPGNNRLEGDGLDTAEIVRLAMVADYPSPEEPAFRPTTQFVAA